MSWDDLNAPLGLHKRKRLLKLPAAAPQLLAGALGLFVIAVAVWAIFANGPLDGEPAAVVAIPPVAKQVGGDRAPDTTGAIKAAVPATPVAPPGTQTITIIDGSSGKRRDVIVPGNASGDAGKR